MVATNQIEREAETRRARGPMILAHPFVACGLALWLFNDHVLKAEFGSWWTGKLSDFVGLLVFPLLVATGLERFISRPLVVAVGFTAAFFSAINLWAPADSATEWLLGFVIDSQLTMDPTDLVALPVLAGTWWVWHRPERTQVPLRHSWGRLVFGIGLVATLASARDLAGGSASGTAVLTVDDPTVTISYKSDNVDSSRPGFTWGYTSFAGGGASSDSRLAVAGEITRDGSDGELTFTLHDPSIAPVEVDFSLASSNEGGVFFGPSTPEFTFGEGASERLREPLSTWTVMPDTGVAPWQWALTVDGDDEVLLGASSRVNVDELIVATVDGLVELQGGTLTSVPKPASCALVNPCSFNLWVVIKEPPRAGEDGIWGDPVGGPIHLYGSDGVVVVDPVQPDLVATMRRFEAETFRGIPGEDLLLRSQLSLPELGEFDNATSFVQISTSVREQPPGADDLFFSGRPYGYARPHGWPFSRSDHQVAINGCCEPVDFKVGVWSGQVSDENGDETVVEVTAVIEVTIWSLNQHDPAEIELVITPLDG